MYNGYENLRQTQDQNRPRKKSGARHHAHRFGTTDLSMGARALLSVFGLELASKDADAIDRALCSHGERRASAKSDRPKRLALMDPVTDKLIRVYRLSQRA